MKYQPPPVIAQNQNGTKLVLLNEPFTDINGNGQWDIGEPFTDVNGNGKWDPAKLSPPTFISPNSNQSELDFYSQGQQLRLLDSPGISCSRTIEPHRTREGSRVGIGGNYFG